MDAVILWQTLGLLAVLAFYHTSEYVIHKRVHPKSTDYTGFLMTPKLLAAFLGGYAEYAIERCFFPFKSSPRSPVLWIGVAAIAIGLYIRLGAVLTAGKSFHHRVQCIKKKSHVFVTHGLYRVFRHPGYFGYFLFALGTQVMLQNPLSSIVFSVVLWRFFHSRIMVEERHLLRFFRDYMEYRDRTPTWIPFIK